MDQQEKTNKRLIAQIVALAVVIFAVDLSIPLGVAGGVPYVALILVSLRSPQRRFTLLAGAVGTVFTLLGLLLSPPGGEVWKVSANRFLALFAIWVTVALGLERKRVEMALRNERDRFGTCVQERTAELREMNASLGREINERKRAEEVLRKSEASLSEAQRIAQLGSWDWDIVKNRLQWSDEIYRIFGLTPQSFGATFETFLDSVHPDDRRFVEKSINDSLHGGKTYSINHRILLPEGTERIVHQQGEVLFDKEDKPVRMVGTVQDVTERDRVEQALRASVQEARSAEGMFRGLLESAPDAIVTVSRDGRILMVNSQTEKLFRYERDDLVGQPVEILMPARLRPGHDAHRASYAANPHTRPMGGSKRLWGRRKDGTEFPVEISLSPLHTEDGLMVTSIIRDITERMRVEEAMERLRRQNELILNAAGEGIYGLDLEGNTTFVNPAAARMIGWEVEELRGVPQHAILHHTKADGTPYPREECPIYAAFKDGTIHHVDNEAFWRKDGTSFPVEYISSPIRDEQGKLVGAVVVFSDITSRKQVEEALRVSEMKFRSLAQSANDAIISIDRMGAIVLWNRGAQRIFGYEEEEVLGKPVTLLMPEQYHKSHQEGITRLRMGEKSQLVGNTVELEGLRKDQQKFPMELSLATWETKEGMFHTGIIRDITERRQAEEQLRIFAAKLERSNKELQDFASVAAHDLQEPLRKVQVFGDRLKAKYGKELGEQGSDYLTRMQSATGRMQILINDLLSLSRVTSRARPFVSVNLGEVVRRVLSDLEVRVEQTGGRVEVGEMASFEADPIQIQQLLQNLISNALKFHRKDVPPVVKVHAEHLNGDGAGPAADSNGNGKWCRIMVEDNGIGFDEKYLDRIFTVFQRLHGRSEYEGTGVGLAICRKIAERHGGSITAKSTPGRGASFLITIPVQQSRKESTS